MITGESGLLPGLPAWTACLTAAPTPPGRDASLE
jgi:hypothetical protein